jgi:hypothetical protein
VLSAVHGVSAPVFVDNRESVTDEILRAGSQTINIAAVRGLPIQVSAEAPGVVGAFAEVQEGSFTDGLE